MIRFRMSESTTPTKSTVTIGSSLVKVEIADSLVSQIRGLSGRENLSPDHGMLFVYANKKIRNFWMNDMRFPLDVLWIADGKVVGMQENISHELVQGEVVRFKSNEPADMALEVYAGFLVDHGVNIGDSAVLDRVAN